ncbi:MAG TPA: hypothetical protein VGR50_08990 [Terriglobales bacterium]|nr:hypothetical protein [Terriglobales bacterium]
MPFPFLQRGNLADHARQLSLATYQPALNVEGLATGVDNVRTDVFLSGKFTDAARAHVARLIVNYGNVEELVAEDSAKTQRPSSVIKSAIPKQRAPADDSGKMRAKAAEPAEFKRMLVDLQVAGLNRAKAEANVSIDLLVRMAVIKLVRAELPLQFNQVLERCRAKLKTFEGPRNPNPGKAVVLRDHFARFQVNKRTVLRRAGQDLFQTLREIEKQTLGKMRRSLFGDEDAATYDLFMNRLLFTDDGHDDYLNAEHYVMLGNYERDPDKFQTMLYITYEFLKLTAIAPDYEEESILDGYLSAPENGQELVAGGSPDESTPRGRAQKALLGAWVELLERHNVMEHVIASYEVVPLLGEYSPPINAQQLKNALISRTERKRVEGLLQEQGRLSTDNLNAAVKRVDACKGAERAKIAGRFLGDFIRYHRDLRRLEAVASAMDGINVIANEKLRQLSAINNTLYDILLPEEQKPVEEKVVHHVIIKADIRDSTTLTRTLFERGLNPASYFSLNFYEPVNKLLPKYAASKVFIEGDAVILALFEREGEPGFGVGRACVLAREMIDLVRAYNEISEKAGLPTLELGIGISYQDSAPMYLMDGSSQIMISKALNESDRLSSCSRGARKHLDGLDSLFNVYSFLTMENTSSDFTSDEFLLRFNVGGINMNEAAFQKLRQEISLQVIDRELHTLWDAETVRLHHGVVPLGQDAFRRIVVREGKIARIDPRDFAFKTWTEQNYYEVCTHPTIYEYVESVPVSRTASAS